MPTDWLPICNPHQLVMNPSLPQLLHGDVAEDLSPPVFACNRAMRGVKSKPVGTAAYAKGTCVVSEGRLAGNHFLSFNRSEYISD